jgi:hypothetical protein
VWLLLLLDYSIICPSPLPYHLGFMVGLVEEAPLAWYHS